MIFWSQKKVEDLNEAIGESVLEYFSLKPVSSSSGRILTGRIQGSNKEHIFLEISEEDVDYLRNNCGQRLFDIHFNMNRIQFQLQHNALNWLEKHGLFSLLVNNPKFDCAEDEVIDAENFIFK